MSSSAATKSFDEADAHAVSDICARYGNDTHRMMDILLAVQDRFRCVSPEAMEIVAERTGETRIHVEGVASFYHFLSEHPKGRVTIRLCDDVVDRHAGFGAVAAAFENAFGIGMGETSADGLVSLETTPCIGMCDQAPAALINEVVVTRLTPEKARKLAADIKAGTSPEALIHPQFHRLTPHARATTMVDNGIKHASEGLLGPVGLDRGLEAAADLEPHQIIDKLEASGLRGCGGAGFSTGTKWRAAAGETAERKFVFCNADEGEPGTFKDRVLLTERPDLVIEGMTLAARAIGAKEGLIYLRGEYIYLRDHLENVLAERRARGVLGQSIAGIPGFGFDVRIQLGAGAYICGEEGALISSCEGLPGEPKTRPPFPVTRGYLGYPTVVNNVETLCHAARIVERGAQWFRSLGTEGSPGTKLFSVSGDCRTPGIYELPYGVSVRDLLTLAGGGDASAVLIGGPSGTMIGRDSYDRLLTFDDLATAGAVVVFSGTRNLLEIVDYYLGFFVHESCGYCTPCRVGNVFLQKAIQKFRAGHADASDILYLRDLSSTIVETSRCGLGMTSPNPVLSTLDNFPLLYSTVTKEREDGMKATFDIQSAISRGRVIAKRRSHVFDQDFSQ